MKTTVFNIDVVVPNYMVTAQPNTTTISKNFVKRRKRQGYEP